MNSDRFRWICLAALPLLAACEHDGMGEVKSTFGEANRQTMMAQVVDPEPEYDTLVPATSAEHAAQAIDRYSKGTVKQPDRVRSTISTSGSSSSTR